MCAFRDAASLPRGQASLHGGVGRSADASVQDDEDETAGADQLNHIGVEGALTAMQKQPEAASASALE